MVSSDLEQVLEHRVDVEGHQDVRVLPCGRTDRVDFQAFSAYPAGRGSVQESAVRASAGPCEGWGTSGLSGLAGGTRWARSAGAVLPSGLPGRPVLAAAGVTAPGTSVGRECVVSQQGTMKFPNKR